MVDRVWKVNDPNYGEKYQGFTSFMSTLSVHAQTQYLLLLIYMATSKLNKF